MIAPYIVVFFATTALIHLSFRSGSSKAARTFGGGFAAALVAALAGFRDIDVGGPDALLYGRPIFEIAVNSNSFAEAYQEAQKAGAKGEPGYVLLNYIVAGFTDSINVFFFCHALFVALVILCAIRLVGDIGTPSVMWLTYLCTFYVNTFNLLRQSLALSLCVLGVSLIIRGRTRLGLVVGLCGAVFHTSAVFFLLVYAVARAGSKRGSDGRFHWVSTLVLVGAMVLGSIVVIIVLGPRLFDDQYGTYFGAADSGSGLGLEVLYRIVPLVVGVLGVSHLQGVRALDGQGGNSRFDSQGSCHGLGASPFDGKADVLPSLVILLALGVAELVILPIRTLSPSLGRVSMYFAVSRILSYSTFSNSLTVQRSVADLASILFVCAYFYGMFVLSGVADYSSQVLWGS